MNRIIPFTLIIFVQAAQFKKCEKEWLYIYGSCYFVSNYTLNWETSRVACKQADSNLFIINSKEELDRVMLHIKPPAGIYYWVGLNDLEKENDFVWEDDRHTNSEDPLFKQGQNEITQGQCANIDTSDFFLDNWPCNDLSFFICEKDPIKSDSL